MKIRIRFFVEGSTPGDAKAVADAFLEKVGTLGSRPATPALAPYKDNERWYEGKVEVPAQGDARAYARKLGEGLATGWRWVRDGDGALCATDFGAEIGVEGVTWIELDVVA